jgi:hypothetical protein
VVVGDCVAVGMARVADLDVGEETRPRYVARSGLENPFFGFRSVAPPVFLCSDQYMHW